MAFRIITGKIEEFPADVIIDSVGVTSTIHGGICGSIIRAANSDELKQIIDGVNDVYNVGEYFITDGYGLPSKNILHLITPNHDNDENCEQYKDCIRRILNLCQSKHWYKVGIPVIGAGANKYDGIAEDILTEMCEAYCELYEKMDVTLVLAEEKQSRENKERISRESYSRSGRNYHDPETTKKFKSGSKVLSSMMVEDLPKQYNKKYFGYERFAKGREDVVVNGKNIKTINDYVEEYIDKREEKDILFPTSKKIIYRRISIYFGYGKKGKDTYIHAGSDAYGEIKYGYSADKKSLYRLAFALKMTYQEASNFLNFFGYSFSFSGVNEIDDAVKYLLSQHQYGIVEIELEFKKRNIKPSLFAKK